MTDKRYWADLTTAEFDLLAYLASHAGEVVDRDTLYEDVRGIAWDGLERTGSRVIEGECEDSPTPCLPSGPEPVFEHTGRGVMLTPTFRLTVSNQ